jgi:aspartokinase
MTVTALGSLVTAGMFVIASEPAAAQRRNAAVVCAAMLRTTPNLLTCTRRDDGAHPPRDANIRR